MQPLTTLRATGLQGSPWRWAAGCRALLRANPLTLTEPQPTPAAQGRPEGQSTQPCRVPLLPEVPQEISCLPLHPGMHLFNTRGVAISGLLSGLSGGLS